RTRGVVIAAWRERQRNRCRTAHHARLVAQLVIGRSVVRLAGLRLVFPVATAYGVSAWLARALEQGRHHLRADVHGRVLLARVSVIRRFLRANLRAGSARDSGAALAPATSTSVGSRALSRGVGRISQPTMARMGRLWQRDR